MKFKSWLIRLGWFKSIFKHLKKKKFRSFFQTCRLGSESLDSALNVLARALENNKDNPEIWCHYLRLFSKRGTKEEVQEMCETAVEYAPDYQSFWTVSRRYKVCVWNHNSLGHLKCHCVSWIGHVFVCI